MKSVAKDDARTSHTPLDLNIAGKKLTDAGLNEVLDGLKEVLTEGQYRPIFVLEGLNLSGNWLTSKSLAPLAPIIDLSFGFLKHLDVSKNFIKVSTDDECRDWETFLNSFENCLSMVRLELSDFTLFGSRPYEILARVYSRHPADRGDVTPTNSESKLLSAYVDIDCVFTSVSKMSNRSESDELSMPASEESRGMRFIPNCGMRSIPYIVLSNCGLDDTGALWLSYLVEKHHAPDILMGPVKPGSLSTMLRGYEENTGCLGLVYYPNDLLSGTGRRLLAAAEIVRKISSRIYTDTYHTSLDSVHHSG
jgi:hypothetical protein